MVCARRSFFFVAPALVKKIFQMRQKSLEIKINRIFLTASRDYARVVTHSKELQGQVTRQYTIFNNFDMNHLLCKASQSTVVLAKVHTKLIPFQKVWIIYSPYWVANL